MECKQIKVNWSNRNPHPESRHWNLICNQKEIEWCNYLCRYQKEKRIFVICNYPFHPLSQPLLFNFNSSFPLKRSSQGGDANAQQVYYDVNSSATMATNWMEILFSCSAKSAKIYTNKGVAILEAVYTFSPTHEFPGALFVRFSLSNFGCAWHKSRKGENVFVVLDGGWESLPWRCNVVCVVNMMIIFNHHPLTLRAQHVIWFFIEFRTVRLVLDNWIMKPSVMTLMMVPGSRLKYWLTKVYSSNKLSPNSIRKLQHQIRNSITLKRLRAVALFIASGNKR